MSCVFPNMDETTSDNNESDTEGSYDDSHSENVNMKNYDDDFSTNYVRVDDILESPAKQLEHFEHSERLEHSEHEQQGHFVPIRTNDNQENPLNESTLSQSRHPTWMVIDDNE